MHQQRVGLALVLPMFLATCRSEPSKKSPPAKSSTAVAAPRTAVQPSAAVAAPSSVPPAPSKPVQGCPRVLERRLKPAEIPALLDRPNVSDLMAAGASGTPRRVRLRFHHPLAGCMCPTFGLTDSNEWSYVAFPSGVPSGHRYETSKYYGFTQYELTGYFSGRTLDYYEWEEPDPAKRGPPLGGEEESDRQAEYPEFCVEHWCYRPDRDPGLYKETQSAAEAAADRAKYRQVVSEMARNGVPQYPPPRPGEKGSFRDDPAESENE